MTREHAETILTAAEIATARDAGKAWGEQEAELWSDQSDKPHPEWTLGNWCGDNPFDREDDRNEAYDLLLDLAARDAYNAAVEATANV